MKKLAWMLVLGLALTSAGRLMATENEQMEQQGVEASDNAYHGIYGQRVLCEAWPLYTTGYYYWVSYNYNYSYNQAYGTCVYNHGACRFWCRPVW